jgi:hypothetical protein
VRDRVQQGQFRIYWGLGKLNLADYYTKHHAATHHQVMRSKYLYMGSQNTANVSILDSIAQAMHALRGCVKALAPAGLMHLQLEQAIGAPAPTSFSQSIALTQNVHNMEQAMLQTTTAIGTLQQLVGKHVLDKRLASY